MNDNLILILKDYTKPDLNYILEEKYDIELGEGKIEKLNYYEVGARYEEIARGYAQIMMKDFNTNRFKEAEAITLERGAKTERKIQQVFYEGGISIK